MRLLAFAVVILLSPGIMHAASGPRWSAMELAGHADVIAIGKVTASRAEWDRDVNAIYTYITLDVTEILKGDVAAGPLTVKQLGGAVDGFVLSITDQATFRLGEDVLVYLEARPRDGTLYTSALWQGKWELQSTLRGQRLAVRRGPGAHFASEERQLVSDARTAAALASRVTPVAVTAYVADAPMPRASNGFNLLGPFRYLYSPAVDVQTGGQPGLPGGGFSEVQSAIRRWNNAGSSFRYVTGSNDGGPRCSGQMLGNGRVTITFMDPCGEMSDTGGTLALGGSYYLPGEGGSSNGQPFERAVEGFIVNNDSPTALMYLTNPGCFEEVQTHELGHVLGLDHSSDPGALMYATIDSTICRNGARGLMADDVQGLFFIYGRTSPLGVSPPSLAPTDVRVAMQSTQLTVTWRDLTAGASSSATGYRLDFRSGHREDGPVVASLTSASTSATMAVPPGVAGDFNVVVTGLNAGGAGPPSERHDFTLGIAAGTCATAPAPVGDLGGSVTAGFARVSWTAVPGATSYLIQAGTHPGSADLYARTNVGSATEASAAVAEGFRGWVRVVAVNACGASLPADAFVQ
jgi:hypothetical protein